MSSSTSPFGRPASLESTIVSLGELAALLFRPPVGGGRGFFETGQFVWGSAKGVLQPNIDFEHSLIVLRPCGIGRGLRSQVIIIFPCRINRNIHLEPLTCAQ